MANPLGLSGRLAAAFQDSQITPLLALVGLLLGLFAAVMTPREEDPQINVTMANIFIASPGSSVADIENLITSPMEQILGEIKDVDHIYSVSNPGQAIITVQYKVGVPRTEALVRLYNAIYSNQDWRPSQLNVMPPLVKPKGIDDVPIVTLTLSTDDPSRGAFDLKQIAHALEIELKRIPGTRNVYTIGGPEQIAKVTLDPQKLAARQMSVSELSQALTAANHTLHAGAIIHDNTYIPVQAGQFISHADELAKLIVGVKNNKPVYLQEVADIEYGPAENHHYVWSIEQGNKGQKQPAVTLTISKKTGENAVTIADKVIERVHQLEGSFIPEGVKASITRNYGDTANDKASKLIHKLIFATLSVVVLVLFTLGVREAIVIGSAVILTLAMTLFASWAWGFTINRVSLFALIFSIGILVDDAIVIVENIHRHITHAAQSLVEAIPIAVNEVGGPTILATFTVIAALLPMAFVSGLMGPYMSPIPINASMGMLISLIIAMTFTPWLSRRLIRHTSHESSLGSRIDRGIDRLFEQVMTPFLGNNRARRWGLAGVILALILLAVSLVFFKVVILKMLPFDNKSEFQIIVDMPEGTPVEQTNTVLSTLTEYLMTVPEVTDVQGYAGTAAPIGFNGLVRQYYLRQAPHMGDLQVNLKDKHDRNRSSHEIASQVRSPLVALATPLGANIKVVEVPPGPPVFAPLLAEIYGPDYPGQIDMAQKLKAQFQHTNGVVDIDDSVEAQAPRLIVVVDRQKAALLGVSQQEITTTLAAALGGLDVTYLNTGHAKYPIPIRLEVPLVNKADLGALLNLQVRNSQSTLVPMSELVEVEDKTWEHSIYHKDLLPVVYVMGDMAGKVDSPLYGMIAMMGTLKDTITQHWIAQPENTYDYSMKWDGEWQITYETFRDMGLAYSVGLILIYLLVVGQFRSYVVPLIIMAPIPLTIIGVLPGHALLRAQFTATSMIGMIALAGIIVRNSILLVDFINKALESGSRLEMAVIQASSVRAKPIVLTAIAAMLGGFFIIDDPIFNGLAVSLIFGIFVSTILTLVVIPLLYYSYLRWSEH